MKKEEVEYMKDMKRRDGLDEYSANSEISDFISTQKGYSLLKRELKAKDTLINNLQNKLKKFRERIIKYKQKQMTKSKTNPTLKKHSNLGKEMFSQDLSKEELKKNKKFINRIVENIEYGKSYTVSDMIRELMVPKKKIGYCIDNLIEKDFIGSNYVKGHLRYFKK